VSWSDGLLPGLRDAAQQLFAAGQRVDPTLRVTSARRSRAEQSRLYRRYLAGQSRFPAAPPGRSLHETGRAWDMYTTRGEVLEWLGRTWISWGGRWYRSDPIHFEA